MRRKVVSRGREFVGRPLRGRRALPAQRGMTERRHWQRRYIEFFLDAVADWAKPEAAKGAVVARIEDYEPTDELQMLMELSVEPVATQLGLLGQ